LSPGVVLFCCFFSSRRRHTRFSRDWSSDVCSSDLYYVIDPDLAGFPGSWTPEIEVVGRAPTGNITGAQTYNGAIGVNVNGQATRSEERRVGKECRDRRSAEHERNHPGSQRERSEAH